MARERRLRTAEAKSRQRPTGLLKNSPRSDYIHQENSYEGAPPAPHPTPANTTDSSSSSISVDLARVKTELTYSESLRSAAEQRARDAEAKLAVALERLRSVPAPCGTQAPV